MSSRVYPDLERVPGKQNWVDKTGGLPSYIERIAKHLHYEKGRTIGAAIATAVETTRRWCSTGKNWNGGDLKPATRAKACKAAASWEAKKAKSKAKTAAKKLKESAEMTEARELVEAKGALPCDDMVAKEIAGLVGRRLVVAEGMLPLLKEPKTVGKRGLVRAAIELLEAELGDEVKIGMVGGPAAEPRDMKIVADLLEQEVEELRALAESFGGKTSDDKPWEKENPKGKKGKKGKGKKLSPSAKKKAKARAKKAGRKYPNLIDNMAAAKEMSEGGGMWLRRGSKGEGVKEVQEQVESMGRWIGDAGADGKFGYNTEQGVKAVQRREGLKADGVVGPKTKAMLDEKAKKPEMVEAKGVHPYDANRGNKVVGGRTEAAAFSKSDAQWGLNDRLKGRDGKGVSDPDFEKKHPRGRGGRWIQKGASGAEVKGIQRDLGMKKASGEFDEGTEQAVRRFQEQNNLQVDGIVGSQTAAAMMDSEAPVGQITDQQRKFLAGRAKRPAGRPLGMREAVEVPEWSDTGVRGRGGKVLQEATDKGAIAQWLDAVAKAAMNGDAEGLASMFKSKTWPESWDADIDEMLYEGEDEKLEAMREVIDAIRKRGDQPRDAAFFRSVLADEMDDEGDDPEDMEEADVAGSGAAEAATDGNAVEAPDGPPNLRESRGGDMRCETCEYFEDGKCLTHGGHSVKGTQVCDSWEAEMTDVEEASVRSAARSGLRALRDVSIGLPDLGDRKTARPIYRLPDGTFAPKGMGAILKPGDEVTIDGKRGRVSADGKSIEVPGESKKAVAPQAMDSPETDREIEKEAKRTVGRKARGMDSPELDKEIEKDAKREVGRRARGADSPETDAEIEKDAKVAMGRRARGMDSPNSLTPPWSPTEFGGWRRGRVAGDDKGQVATFTLGGRGGRTLSYDRDKGWQYSGPLTDDQVANLTGEGDWKRSEGATGTVLTGPDFAQIISDGGEHQASGIPVNEADAREIAANKSRNNAFGGMDSPEVDREVEKDAKRAAGRRAQGMDSPETDREIEKDAKRAVGRAARGADSPGEEMEGTVADLKRGDILPEGTVTYLMTSMTGNSRTGEFKEETKVYLDGAERDGGEPMVLDADAPVTFTRPGSMDSPGSMDNAAEALAMAVGDGGRVEVDGEEWVKGPLFVNGQAVRSVWRLGGVRPAGSGGEPITDEEMSQRMLADPNSRVTDAGDIGMDSPEGVFRKPRVADAEGWELDPENEYNLPVRVERPTGLAPGSDLSQGALNAWYKVTAPGKRPKYFFGESAWSDAARYASDESSKIRREEGMWSPGMDSPDSRGTRHLKGMEKYWSERFEYGGEIKTRGEIWQDLEQTLAASGEDTSVGSPGRARIERFIQGLEATQGREGIGGGMDSPAVSLAAKPGDRVRIRPEALDVAKDLDMDFGGDDGEAIVLTRANADGMVAVQRDSDGKVYEVRANSLMTPGGFAIGRGNFEGMDSPEVIPTTLGSEVVIDGKTYTKRLTGLDAPNLPSSGWTDDNGSWLSDEQVRERLSPEAAATAEKMGMMSPTLAPASPVREWDAETSGPIRMIDPAGILLNGADRAPMGASVSVGVEWTGEEGPSAYTNGTPHYKVNQDSWESPDGDRLTNAEVEAAMVDVIRQIESNPGAMFNRRGEDSPRPLAALRLEYLSPDMIDGLLSGPLGDDPTYADALRAEQDRRTGLASLTPSEMYAMSGRADLIRMLSLSDTEAADLSTEELRDRAERAQVRMATGGAPMDSPEQAFGERRMWSTAEGSVIWEPDRGNWSLATEDGQVRELDEKGAKALLSPAQLDDLNSYQTRRAGNRAEMPGLRPASLRNNRGSAAPAMASPATEEELETLARPLERPLVGPERSRLQTRFRTLYNSLYGDLGTDLSAVQIVRRAEERDSLRAELVAIRERLNSDALLRGQASGMASPESPSWREAEDEVAEIPFNELIEYFPNDLAATEEEMRRRLIALRASGMDVPSQDSDEWAQAEQQVESMTLAELIELFPDSWEGESAMRRKAVLSMLMSGMDSPGQDSDAWREAEAEVADLSFDDLLEIFPNDWSATESKMRWRLTALKARQKEMDRLGMESPGDIRSEVADALGVDPSEIDLPSDMGPVVPEPAELRMMNIAALADLIQRDWGSVNYAAVPYLEAMFTLDNLDSVYGVETGRDIIPYFLANARSWTGPTARAVKKELKDRLAGNGMDSPAVVETLTRAVDAINTWRENLPDLDPSWEAAVSIGVSPELAAIRRRTGLDPTTGKRVAESSDDLGGSLVPKEPKPVVPTGARALIPAGGVMKALQPTGPGTRMDSLERGEIVVYLTFLTPSPSMRLPVWKWLFLPEGGGPDDAVVADSPAELVATLGLTPDDVNEVIMGSMRGPNSGPRARRQMAAMGMDSPEAYGFGDVRRWPLRPLRRGQLEMATAADLDYIKAALMRMVERDEGGETATALDLLEEIDAGLGLSLRASRSDDRIRETLSAAISRHGQENWRKGYLTDALDRKGLPVGMDSPEEYENHTRLRLLKTEDGYYLQAYKEEDRVNLTPEDTVAGPFATAAEAEDAALNDFDPREFVLVVPNFDHILGMASPDEVPVVKLGDSVEVDGVKWTKKLLYDAPPNLQPYYWESETGEVRQTLDMDMDSPGDQLGSVPGGMVRADIEYDAAVRRAATMPDADAQTFVQGARQRRREASMAGMDSPPMSAQRLAAFHEGRTVALPDGKLGTVRGLEPGGPGTYLVEVDGSMRVTHERLIGSPLASTLGPLGYQEGGMSSPEMNDWLRAKGWSYRDATDEERGFYSDLLGTITENRAKLKDPGAGLNPASALPVPTEFAIRKTLSDGTVMSLTGYGYGAYSVDDGSGIPMVIQRNPESTQSLDTESAAISLFLTKVFTKEFGASPAHEDAIRNALDGGDAQLGQVMVKGGKPSGPLAGMDSPERFLDPEDHIKLRRTMNQQARRKVDRMSREELLEYLIAELNLREREDGARRSVELETHSTENIKDYISRGIPLAFKPESLGIIETLAEVEAEMDRLEGMDSPAPISEDGPSAEQQARVAAKGFSDAGSADLGFGFTQNFVVQETYSLVSDDAVGPGYSASYEFRGPDGEGVRIEREIGVEFLNGQYRVTEVTETRALDDDGGDTSDYLYRDLSKPDARVFDSYEEAHEWAAKWIQGGVLVENPVTDLLISLTTSPTDTWGGGLDRPMDNLPESLTELADRVDPATMRVMPVGWTPAQMILPGMESPEEFEAMRRLRSGEFGDPRQVAQQVSGDAAMLGIQTAVADRLRKGELRSPADRLRALLPEARRGLTGQSLSRWFSEGNIDQIEEQLDRLAQSTDDPAALDSIARILDSHAPRANGDEIVNAIKAAAAQARYQRDRNRGMDSPNFRAPSYQQLNKLSRDQWDRLDELSDLLAAIPSDSGVVRVWINGVSWEKYSEFRSRFGSSGAAGSGPYRKVMWMATAGDGHYNMGDRDSDLDIAWGLMRDPDGYIETEGDADRFLTDQQREVVTKAQAALESARAAMGMESLSDDVENYQELRDQEREVMGQMRGLRRMNYADDATRRRALQELSDLEDEREDLARRLDAVERSEGMASPEVTDAEREAYVGVGEPSDLEVESMTDNDLRAMAAAGSELGQAELDRRAANMMRMDDNALNKVISDDSPMADSARAELDRREAKRAAKDPADMNRKQLLDALGLTPVQAEGLSMDELRSRVEAKRA